ncbi:MAG TPA: hypothetical protein VI168_08875 [Croceibacterium sp.]
MHMSRWRNFASSGVAAGIVSLGVTLLASWLANGVPPRALLAIPADPRVAVALLASVALVGLTSRDTPFSWRRFANFAIFAAAASAFALLAIAGVRTGAFGAMGVSQWVAVSAGLVLVFFASCLGLVQAVARSGWTLLEPEQIELLRERARLNVLSATAIAALGLALIVLSLAGPESVLPPAAALAGALVLLAAATVPSVAAWRLMDELDRTLTYETGNLSFYLVLLLGGGWATLAHLGFIPAAAPLDWLTMLAVISFPATYIAAGRRRLLSK